MKQKGMVIENKTILKCQDLYMTNEKYEISQSQ